MNSEGYLRDGPTFARGHRTVRARHRPTATRLGRAATCAIGALMMAGCCHNLYVRGAREPGVGRIGTMTPIYVELEKGSDDAERDRELADKIERVLTDKGFTVVPESEAVANLYFAYEIDDLLQRKYLQPIPGSSSGMKTVPAEGPFVHRLSVSVVRSKTDAAATDPPTKVLWVGGAVLNATSIRAPEVVDILIVALFDHFPEDTGKTVRVSMKLDDPRAEHLRSGTD